MNRETERDKQRQKERDTLRDAGIHTLTEIDR